MTSKKSSQASGTGTMTALKIGSRVRCTDDGVEGRIVWANAVSVKIRWDDGEQVTWRRDSLAGRPIEILDSVGKEEQGDTTAAGAEGEQTLPVESMQGEPAPLSLAPGTAPTETAASDAEDAPAEGTPPVPETATEMTPPSDSGLASEDAAKPKRQRKASAAPKAKRLSALDAAARVLAETGQPMSCQELIAAMAEQNYWKSPGGKTPAATLYSAILKEISTKGAASRFVKTDRGKFAHTGAT